MSDLMNAPFSDAWFHRLKAAQRDLIKHCGGIERCAEITSLSKSQIGRWNNPTDPDLITVAAALRLEAECGLPLVTSAMAGVNGRRLADPDEQSPQQVVASIMDIQAEIGVRFGDLFAELARATQDLKITSSEATGIHRTGARARNAIDDLLNVVAKIKAANGFTLVVGGNEGGAA